MTRMTERGVALLKAHGLGLLTSRGACRLARCSPTTLHQSGPQSIGKTGTARMYKIDDILAWMRTRRRGRTQQWKRAFALRLAIERCWSCGEEGRLAVVEFVEVNNVGFGVDAVVACVRCRDTFAVGCWSAMPTTTRRTRLLARHVCPQCVPHPDQLPKQSEVCALIYCPAADERRLESPPAFVGSVDDLEKHIDSN
jgi:hypothetical protein